MVEKASPWWRKALDYALGGLRSGFGLFPRPVQPEAWEEESSVEGPAAAPEEEALKPESVKTEIAADEPEPPAGAAVASDPAPPTMPEPDAKRNSAEQPAEPPDQAASAPIAGASFEEPAKPATTSEAAPAPEPIVVPLIQEAVQIAAQHAASPAAVDPAPAVGPVPADLPVSESLATPVFESIPASATAPPPVAASQPAPEPAPEPKPAPISDPKPLPKAPIKLETRDDEADLSPFSVVVEQVYDGPLDLLLDLIRKQDIDIYDIPIARITAQFLAYVNRLKAGDVDVAGEFIYIASLLIHIKSKMLLPRAPSGPEEAAEDPRRELVERLLEHERFKNAAQMLQQKQMLEAATWTNPGFREFQEEAAAEPEMAADTVDLVRIFRDILERARNRPVIDLEEDSVTVGQMLQFLARRLTMEDKPVALRRLLQHTRSERALIAMFLALLELVRLQAILLRQDRAFSEIFIKKHTGFDALMNEGLSSARDDWR